MFKQQNPPKAQDSSSPFASQSATTSTEPTAPTVVAPAVRVPSSSTTSSSTSSVTVAAVVHVAANNHGNLLVSEQEDNDVATTSMEDQGFHEEEEEERVESSKSNRANQNQVASGSSSTGGAGGRYAQGQIEVSDGAEDADGSYLENGEDHDGDHDDDESEYSYDYEEDEDGGHYSSFIVTNPSCSTSAVAAAAVSSGAALVPQEEDEDTHNKNNNDNHIITDRPSDQATKRSVAVNNTKNQSLSNNTSRAVSREPSDIVRGARVESLLALSNHSKDSSNTSSSNSINKEEKIQFATLQQTDSTLQSSKSSWKEPSQRAISMSLRAESEKTGGRRRLAADLYKIMMNDTNESGFSVESADEESLDRWTIRLFQFDEDSNLHKDMMILGVDHIELEMNFPDQYPFEPPFVQVVRPRFKKQTGFVMNGALCMELLTNDGWNPINDIESVIVSIRSLLVVGDGRLEAVANMPEAKREKLLAASLSKKENETSGLKRSSSQHDEKDGDAKQPAHKRSRTNDDGNKSDVPEIKGYSTSEAKAAYSHLSSYHKKKGWSGWWAQRG